VPVGPDVTPGGVLRPAVTCGYTLPFQRAGAATDTTSVRVDTYKWIVDVRGTAIVDTGGRQNSWPAPIERMAAAAVSRLPMFLHAGAASGIVLVAAAATALVWVKGSDFPFEEPLVTSAIDQFGRLVLACLDGLPRRIALFCSRSWFPPLCTKSAVTSPPVGATVRWTAQPTPSDPAERCCESSARRSSKCVSATLPWRMGSATHFGARARALR
jgi:hypothetical protein